MKKNLHFFGMLAMLMAISFSVCGQTASPINVMFVHGGGDVEVSTGDLIHERDSLVYEKIIGGALSNWTITLIDHDQTDANDPAVEEAISNSDVIVISSSVSSGNVAGNTSIMEGDLPILSLEYGTWDDQLMYYGGQNDYEIDDFVITMGDEAPPEAFGDLGAEVVFGDTAVSAAKARFPHEDYVLAAGCEIYGSVMLNDTLRPAYIYADAGAQLISPETGNDTTARNYAQMMYGLLEPGSAKQITDEGWEIFERALCLLVFEDYPASTGIFETPSSISSFYFANKALYLDLDNSLMETGIQIFSISGQLMLQKNVGPNEVIELSHLQTGLYIVKGADFAGKFVVK